jgi:hypothetical protein
MKNYREQITDEYISAIKRLFPYMDDIELEKFEAVFKAGFDAGCGSSSEIGQKMFISYFSNLNIKEVVK